LLRPRPPPPDRAYMSSSPMKECVLHRQTMLAANTYSDAGINGRPTDGWTGGRRDRLVGRPSGRTGMATSATFNLHCAICDLQSRHLAFATATTYDDVAPTSQPTAGRQHKQLNVNVNDNTDTNTNTNPDTQTNNTEKASPTSTFLRGASFVPSFVRSFALCGPFRTFRSSKTKTPNSKLQTPNFVRSFIHSFVRSFIRSFVRSFVHSFVRSFVRSLIERTISLYSILNW